MLALLTPKFWIGLALVTALAFTHGFAYKSGRAAVRAQWDKERAEMMATALRASEAARVKEQVLNTANAKVTNDYLVQKKLRAADAVAADGKLRELRSALNSPSSADTATESGNYGDPRSSIIAGCASTVVVLDEAAKRMADQTTALQRYIREMHIK